MKTISNSHPSTSTRTSSPANHSSIKTCLICNLQHRLRSANQKCSSIIFNNRTKNRLNQKYPAQQLREFAKLPRSSRKRRPSWRSLRSVNRRVRGLVLRLRSNKFWYHHFHCRTVRWRSSKVTSWNQSKRIKMWALKISRINYLVVSQSLPPGQKADKYSIQLARLRKS